jgi:tRNA modification GTPase
MIDRGVAIHFPAPGSYTGEEMLELQAHGGPVVLRSLLERCLHLGARVAEPGEFTKRAFLNDKVDLAQAEGVIDLIDAATQRAARCATRSLTGEFSTRIQGLNEKVVGLRAHVEATLDFPEEEIDAVAESAIEDGVRVVSSQLQAVLDASRQGSLLRDGMDVVLAGRPNVGKSSLLNRLTGEELAIVTDIPGTTRDVIRQVIDLDGIPVRIIDTAGLRAARDVVEKIGVERTWQAITRADLVIMMTDATCGETAEDREILERFPRRLPCLSVVNKIDLTGVVPQLERSEKGVKVSLSAQTGAGVDLLRKALLEAIGWHGASDEGLYLARERHLQALGQAKAHLEAAAAHGRELELLAEELRLAQRCFSAVTGEFTADDLLGEIFARFCIGK